MGVQWHPEALTYGGDTTMLKIFHHLIGKAETFHQAKEMHKHFLSVDTHTDTPFWFKRAGFSIADRERNRVNIPKMQEGKLETGCSLRPSSDKVNVMRPLYKKPYKK